MTRISSFMSISLDGYYKTPDGDIGWSHGGNADPEFVDFIAGNSAGGDVLLFGHTTYEMMVSFWPTPAAAAQFPVVAKHINASRKVVLSRRLTEATWHNTTVERDAIACVRKLKEERDLDVTILGSGSIVAQLARAGLIDEYQLVVVPIALGAGASMFAGLDQQLPLVRTRARTFANGNAYLVYEPRR
jgi:dihydrofolate reductase